MSQNLDNPSPFTGLFAKENITADPTGSHPANSSSSINILDTKINALIEKIFMFTINKNHKKQLVFMEDISAQSENGLLNVDLLEQALFERLLLNNPEDFLLANNRIEEQRDRVVESRVIIYLYNAYETCELSRNQNDSVLMQVCEQIRGLIMRNVGTAMKQPDLYERQTLPTQWLNLLKDFDNEAHIRREFLISTAGEIIQDEQIAAMGTLKAIFYPMLAEVEKSTRNANMITLERWVLPLINLFVSEKGVPQLGELLLDFTTPNPDGQGDAYAKTLIGQLLSLSILPKNANGPYEFYENVAQSLASHLNSSLWSYLSNHMDQMQHIFKSLLLLGGVVRSKTLAWIGSCLHANAARGQIWNVHNMATMGSQTTGSDAFMIGLCGVLLRLCGPLFKPGLKVMLVDPTYCGVPEADALAKGVHLKKAFEETCLMPTVDGEVRLTAEKYNFITECFFMTHKAIDLSYRVCIEKFIRISREINRVQSAYQDAMSQGSSDVAQNIMQMLTSKMQQFLCLKNTIIEPKTDQHLLQFYDATSIWLAQVTSRNTDDLQGMIAEKSFSPHTLREIKLPLQNSIPIYLKSIPEYVLENIVGYMTFVKHFEDQAIEMDNDAQCSMFSMILIFMGSSERVKNPHLRAKLAEGLESLLPKESSSNSSMRSCFKTQIFENHPDRLVIVPCLLHVFVGIEMTGQSVQFEQKFNYRRPMYTVMEFLWEKAEQKEVFKKLAHEAELNIEAVDPPLFLRFVNLLINDAIFLLDESLSNLQQIRTLQAAQDNGEWNNLPVNERQQNVQNLQHLGMMARFDNILGRDTINILKLITSDIKHIFCHASMVDRIASMLNYFLLNLVGPKKGSFKVKDKKEYEFDPATIVMEICRIYVNLKGSDGFCLAVSQDGRSYSSDLFSYAEQVLVRIGGGQLIGDMAEFATKVERLDKQRQEDQEALVDPPDEYLDPIMSTMMLDPVILPSSHVTVDRTTIARHLLSDQSDPFNRSPLTMDQLQPNVELKAEITQWIEQKRKEYFEKQKQS